MTETRPPPAFQIYASDELANVTYYGLSLSERGLLDAMRRVIWCEHGIPADPAGIALAIRRPERETRDALTADVLRHFRPVEGDPSRLTCPELRRQMARLIERRGRQSAAAAETNKARWAVGERVAKRSDEQVAKRIGQVVASEQNRTEPNRTPSLRVIDERAELLRPAVDPAMHAWTDDYERGESGMTVSADKYRQVSRGE